MLIKLPGEEKAGELDRGYLYNLDTSSAILKLFDVVQPECWHGQPLEFVNPGFVRRDSVVCGHALYACQRTGLAAKISPDGYDALKEFARDGSSAYPQCRAVAKELAAQSDQP